MLTFLTANLTHAEQINSLVNSAYRGESSEAGWTTEASLLSGTRSSVAHVSELILSENSQIELGFSGDELVACVHVKKETSQTLYFGMLTVKPKMQARGFGKFVLNQTETIAKRWGCIQVRISVLHLRAELISYYERRGYVITGRSEPFHVDEAVFGKPKVEGLKLLEMIKRLS